MPFGEGAPQMNNEPKPTAHNETSEWARNALHHEIKHLNQHTTPKNQGMVADTTKRLEMLAQELSVLHRGNEEDLRDAFGDRASQIVAEFIQAGK